MFLELLSQSQRVSDDYINATVWCKKFGKLFPEFKRISTTIDFVESLAKNLNMVSAHVIEAKRGKGGGTWIHPLLTIKLAEWLSPDFEVFVKQTYGFSRPKLASRNLTENTQLAYSKDFRLLILS